MASLTLKQIEAGTANFGTGDSTVTVTLATTLTDTGKTWLFYNSRCNSASPDNFSILGRVLSTTQIQFERSGTGTAAVVEYSVAEFTQGISVQHFYISQSAATVDTTITSVDTGKSFPIISSLQSGSTFGANDLISAEITSATNLRTTISSVSTTPVAAQVIQIDDAAVQVLKPAAWTSGATLDVTVTTITENKTFWFWSFTDTITETCDHWPYCSYVNSTTVRFTKVQAGSAGSKNIVLYVVSLSSGVTVQNISTAIATGTASISPTISTVTVANTALSLSGIYLHLASSSEANDNAGDGAFSLGTLTTTSFTATRAASPAYTATTNVQVLEFVAAASSASWFLLPWKNELYNTQNINGMR